MSTVKELRKALDEAGVEYSPRARKAELEQLAADNNVGVEGVDSLPPPSNLHGAVNPPWGR